MNQQQSNSQTNKPPVQNPFSSSNNYPQQQQQRVQNYPQPPTSQLPQQVPFQNDLFGSNNAQYQQTPQFPVQNQQFQQMPYPQQSMPQPQPQPQPGIFGGYPSSNAPVMNSMNSNYASYPQPAFSNTSHHNVNLNLNLKYDDDEPLEERTTTKSEAKETEAQDLESAIELSIRIKQKTLQSSSFNDQTVPFLVSLKAGKLKAESKVPIDLVCVIDHSGSMGGEKIELVKNTFTYLLEYLDSADRLCIVIFDNYASRLVPFLRTTAENKKKILSALQNVFGNGGTDINLGMVHAFESLKQRRYHNQVSSIFLLSDGLDGGAQHKIKSTMTQLQVPEDITINTFGYGRDHDPQLMTDIANLRDGGFYFIDRLDQVDEAFVDCLGGLINSIAQNAQIKIKSEEPEALKGVEIVKAFGDASMWTHEGQTYTTKMATLIGDKQKDFVLEIKIPKNTAELLDHQKSIHIATAEATVTGLDGKKVVKKAELFITLLNETEEVKEQEQDDKEVMKNFYRVKGAELLDEARKLADQRRNDEAKKILQGFKEEIMNSFLKEEEFIKNMVKDMDKALEYVNPQVYQAYGRQNLFSNQKAQMQQKVDLNMYNCYQAPAQNAMTNYVQSQKPFPKMN